MKQSHGFNDFDPSRSQLGIVALGTNILSVSLSGSAGIRFVPFNVFSWPDARGGVSFKIRLRNFSRGPVVSLSSFSQSTSTSGGSSFDEDLSPLEPLVRHNQIDGVGLGCAADELCQHR